MVTNVAIQSLAGTEELFAQGALIQLLSQVRHFVHLEHMVVAKGLATDLTFIGLLTSVRADVDLELLGASEALLAVLTGVGFLPGVSPHVDHKLA